MVPPPPRGPFGRGHLHPGPHHPHGRPGVWGPAPPRPFAPGIFHPRPFPPIVLGTTALVAAGAMGASRFIYMSNRPPRGHPLPHQRKYWVIIPDGVVPGSTELTVVIEGKEYKFIVPNDCHSNDKVVVVIDPLPNTTNTTAIPVQQTSSQGPTVQGRIVPDDCSSADSSLSSHYSESFNASALSHQNQVSCPRCTVLNNSTSMICSICGSSLNDSIPIAEASYAPTSGLSSATIISQAVPASSTSPETGNTWRLSDEDIMLGKNLFIQHYNQFHPESQIVSRDTNGMNMSLFFTNEEAFQVMKMLTPLTPLSFHDFSQLWLLSDRDRDSHLNVMEFCMAVGLVRRFQQGHGWPSTLLASCWPSMDASITKS